MTISLNVDEIFDRLLRCRVELSADSTVLGPSYLHDKTVETRNHMNDVHQYLTECSRELHRLKSVVLLREAGVNHQVNLLLTGDKVEGATVTERMAHAKVKLHSQYEELALEVKERDQIEDLFKAVKVTYKDLEGTLAAIRLQRSLIGDEIALKPFYGGDGKDTSKGSSKPKDVSIYDDLEDDITSPPPKKNPTDDLLSELDNLSIDETPAPKAKAPLESDALESMAGSRAKAQKSRSSSPDALDSLSELRIDAFCDDMPAPTLRDDTQIEKTTSDFDDFLDSV